MMSILETHSKFASIDNERKGGSGLIKVYVNLYPYEFSSIEETLIISGISSRLSEKITVIPVYDANTSPDFIHKNISTLIMYDGITWVENNVKLGKLKKYTLTNVELIVPDILHTPEKIDMDKDELLTMLANIFIEYIDLTFVAVGMFSSQIKK